ncbi:hypothetical protein RFI_27213 [Reticulomyxa filosa]|uniref:Sulfotransferase family protein n=1 Tax=Reticulomyxa filosa TaxID=46433 RepID=X6M8B8_RETFI|nr:hypothetical protein RFI_27213 [Reticulomyxa filosa]|eukprot:ETO10164.1 hypothetical protein RFI_27213 [Reticulomyxa filosa]
MTNTVSDHELDIIGAGFGRTGTTSLKLALDTLGYKCYHIMETFSNLSDWDKWHDVSQLSKEERENWNWDLIYEPRKYTAALDSPTADYWELIRDYYNKKKEKKSSENTTHSRRVKVIVTIRDNPEIWYESMMKTVVPMSEQNNRWFPRLINTNFVDSIYAIHWNGTFEGRYKDKDFAIQKYWERIEEVKKKVPKEDLLIYNVKEGWEPLCRFLHKEIPTDPQTGSVIPFPVSNSTQEFETKIRFVKALNNIATITAIALAVGSVVGVAYYWRRKKLI